MEFASLLHTYLSFFLVILVANLHKRVVSSKSTVSARELIVKDLVDQPLLEPVQCFSVRIGDVEEPVRKLVTLEKDVYSYGRARAWA